MSQDANDIWLSGHITKLANLHAQVDKVAREGTLMELALLASEMESAARSMGFRLNDIMAAKGKWG